MAKQSKTLGLALTVTGIGLAIWGQQMSSSIGSQISEAVTGSYTDKVMLLYIGGAASFVVGLYLLAKK